MPALASLVALALAAPPVADAVLFRAGPGDGQVVIHVYKKGLFSGFAHDHAFQPGQFSVTASLPAGDPTLAQVEVQLDARTLEDQEPALSAGDRHKVSAQARGPDLLDAERYPDITWRCDRLDLVHAAAGGALHGTAHGTLTLHGQERPLDLAVETTPEGPGWKVRAHGRLLQSDHGIRPFSSMGGALAVKDAVEVEVELVLRAAAGRG